MDATTVGTPQTAFVQDAARQSQFAQSFFYTLGDIFAGTDSSARITTGAGNTVDVGVDAFGQPYVRGTTAGLQTGQAAQPQGFVVTPTMIIAGLLAVLLITHSKG